MTTDLTHRELRDLPKVELHRHLDGSVRLETIVDLAKRHANDLEVESDVELQKKAKIRSPKRDLKEALSCFWLTQKVLCSYEAIRRVEP